MEDFKWTSLNKLFNEKCLTLDCGLDCLMPIQIIDGGNLFLPCPWTQLDQISIKLFFKRNKL